MKPATFPEGTKILVDEFGRLLPTGIPMKAEAICAGLFRLEATKYRYGMMDLFVGSHDNVTEEQFRMCEDACCQRQLRQMMQREIRRLTDDVTYLARVAKRLGLKCPWEMV